MENFLTSFEQVFHHEWKENVQIINAHLSNLNADSLMSAYLPEEVEFRQKLLKAYLNLKKFMAEDRRIGTLLETATVLGKNLGTGELGVLAPYNDMD